MIPIPSGSFSMGSAAVAGPPYFGDTTTQPVHAVTISQDFWVGRYEVTQSEYQTLMGTNPSGSVGANLPVENVSWQDARAYCAALMAQESAQGNVPTGYEYRLPTEAEWEFACRSGTATEYSSGPALVCVDASFALSYHSNNFCNTSGIEPVGSYPANAWGLHDMHGNVWEWCLDGYAAYTQAVATDPYTPQGLDYLLRGGSWAMESDKCRSGYRRHEPQSLQTADVGFRVVLGPILNSTNSITLPSGGEGFEDNSGENDPQSGASWGQNDRLAQSFGGGSGRLGSLVVGGGETLVLNTDSQGFPLGTVVDVIGNPNGAGDFPTSITVTDGVFEFSSLTIQPGGILKFVGSNPARVLVRGELDVTAGGIIDVSGNAPGAHSGLIAQPEVTLAPTFPLPPANAGAGGWGGDRYDFDSLVTFIAIGGIDIPENVAENNDGRDGQGLGGTAMSRGLGGVHNPLNFPTEDTLFPAPLVGLGSHGAGTAFPLTTLVDFIPMGCFIYTVGTAGSGGGYALDGGDAQSVSPTPLASEPLGASNDGAANPGGVAPVLAAPSETNVGYTHRTLDWTAGFLMGGSGGGGGGMHPYDTRTNLIVPNPCPSPIDESVRYDIWHDHSGARGGDGGGAIHLVAGKRIRINGVVDAGGGNGGSSTGGNSIDYGRHAMPGGGGSGGSIRIQAPELQVSPVGGRIDVSGGNGGAGLWATTIFGGGGSMGLVRIETETATMLHESIAPSIAPYMGDFAAPFNDVDKSLDFLSIDSGGLAPQTQRPDSINASVSCWIELPAGYSTVDFADDDPSGPGWDMDVIWQPGVVETALPFRASSVEFGANGFEGMFGNLLGNSGLAGSPIVVRFQGARTLGALANPCNVLLSGANHEIIPASLTTWVDHPAKLNGIGVNTIRYTIMFDNTNDPGNGDIPGVTLASIKGITNLAIRATVQ